MTTDTFAARFAAARAALGLTQAQAAGRIGHGKSYVGLIETGRVAVSLDKAHDLATRLGIDPATLDPRLASAKPARRAPAGR